EKLSHRQWYCPITLDLIKDPVVLGIDWEKGEDGHGFVPGRVVTVRQGVRQLRAGLVAGARRAVLPGRRRADDHGAAGPNAEGGGWVPQHIKLRPNVRQVQ
ncbi:unnamed protein product, partial [Amoebophrya sp. A120]